MKRSAYLTTGFAIKMLSWLSKADIIVHGQENIPEGPVIFVINHFTRIETLLLPYHLYNLTGVPVQSLASASLFKSGLEKFFDLVGAISTSDPHRDEIIIRSLLTGEANWIIFPEGSMVKNKKIVDSGRYMIADSEGPHEPHTGAAALALQTELYRRHILNSERNLAGTSQPVLDLLGIESPRELHHESTAIVPVNLTYYPIRAAENLALTLASRMVKDISERAIEELMTEGTMMLSGVDIDMRIGRALTMTDYLKREWLSQDIVQYGISGYALPEALKKKMKETAHDIMQSYMHDIYAMTTINQEHLFASFLRLYPFSGIQEREYLLRVYLVASVIKADHQEQGSFRLHKSLDENQAHLLTDDRYGKYENFLKLAIEKDVVTKTGGYLFRNRKKLSGALSFHRGRIENPIEIMANEVEPLEKLQKLVHRICWLPLPLLKLAVIRYIYRGAKRHYLEDRKNSKPTEAEQKMVDGSPLLFPASRRKIGVILIHSYLAVPEEVRELAEFLNKRGYWVYLPRLPGHGTSADDLAYRSYNEWVEIIENSYVLMSCICDKVVVGGAGVGGSLALDIAIRAPEIAGVFAISPAFSLKDYSTRFMPGTDMWNRILQRVRGDEDETEFYEFDYGNLALNYSRNPLSGIKEVGDLLEANEERYTSLHQPAIIFQADDNPVVEPEGTRKVYELLGASQKEYCQMSANNHIMIDSNVAQKVYKRIAAFIKEL